jgi:hypothetical protein
VARGGRRSGGFADTLYYMYHNLCGFALSLFFEHGSALLTGVEVKTLLFCASRQ